MDVVLQAEEAFGHHALEFSPLLLGCGFLWLWLFTFWRFFTARPVSGVYYLMIAQSLPCWSHSGCCELKTRKILSRNVLNYDAAKSRSHINTGAHSRETKTRWLIVAWNWKWFIDSASWWSLLMLFADVRSTWISSVRAKFNYHRFSDGNTIIVCVLTSVFEIGAESVSATGVLILILK